MHYFYFPEDKFIFLLITVGVFAITIMLVFGAAKVSVSSFGPDYILYVVSFITSTNAH